MLSRLDPDQNQHFIVPELEQNPLQMFLSKRQKSLLARKDLKNDMPHFIRICTVFKDKNKSSDMTEMHHNLEVLPVTP